MTNPFTNRSMIKDQACFVGRIRELEDIVPRLNFVGGIADTIVSGGT